MKKVLVVEDEAAIREFVVINLQRSGYEALQAESGEQALEIIEKVNDINIFLLDVMLPGIDGFELCRKIRQKSAAAGIIMLTARSQETDKITGLIGGADDYVTKPFSPSELVLRVDALYRRVGKTGSKGIRSGIFFLNEQARSLQKDTIKIEMTQVEYQLMKLFMQNPNRAFSREEISAAVWSSESRSELKTVDVNIRRLRMKIEDDPSNPRHIETLWGYGYKWIE